MGRKTKVSKIALARSEAKKSLRHSSPTRAWLRAMKKAKSEELASRGINPKTGKPLKSPTAYAINHLQKYTPGEDRLICEFPRHHLDRVVAKDLGRSVDGIQARRRRIKNNRRR